MHPTHPPVYPMVGTPADILRAAAHYISLYGWHRGNSYYPLSPDTSTMRPPACAMGALGIVIHGCPEANPFDPSLAGAPLYQAAYNTLLDYLEVADDYTHETPDAGVGDWNDHPGQSAAQVIAGLHQAADRWDHLSGGAA